MLKTLDLALKVIRMFTKDKPVWGGRELANELQMDHAKIYRILETFEANNFIYQDPVTKKYSLGLAALELGMTMYDGLNIKEIITPVLDELSQKTGESVFLTVLDKNEAVTLETVEPKNKVKFSVSVGSRAPLYVGASYRSILAYMSEEFIEQYIEKCQFEQFTENTMTDPDDLRNELKRIKKQGWAMSEGEYTPEVIAIAVPLFDRANGIIGSVTVSGPVFRMSDERVREFLPLLQETKDEVEDIITRYQLEIRPK
ncbi:IclR family transcriptional regulator [Oceanobacillus salinisoli]|uniref:IclR family transcriptional regulator n=1 Tax=Oceanobacillus salinisoli TaxID=2678611 RepID=UPI0012E10EFE|nr:IclR family transcriptional regulator [Oceanobacillus salinisoli]